MALSPHFGMLSSHAGDAERMLDRKSIPASVAIVASFSRAVFSSPSARGTTGTPLSPS